MQLVIHVMYLKNQPGQFVCAVGGQGVRGSLNDRHVASQRGVGSNFILLRLKNMIGFTNWDSMEPPLRESASGG